VANRRAYGDWMHTRTSIAVTLALAATALLANAAPARADLPLSVELGAQLPQQTNARNAGGDTQVNVGINYDFIRAPVVPFQVSFHFDDANGSHGSGTLNETAFGVQGRLTTPLYAGLGFSVYNVNSRLAYPNAPSVSATSIGESYFAGYRFLSLPGGVNFALQGTYKQIPSQFGVNPSSFGAGVRVQL